MIMNKRLSFKDDFVRLSKNHQIMLEKLSKIHGYPKNNILEALIQRESAIFGLIESRAGES